MSRICKSIETEGRLVVARGWGDGMGVADNGYRVSFGGDKCIQELGTEVDCTTL